MMAKTSVKQTSKRQRSSNQDCLDRISHLPDEIIEQILCLLPTKDAVSTSIVSKRWSSFWSNLPVLNLQDSIHGKIRPLSRNKFIKFVTRVLFLSKAAPLQKFQLNCRPIYEPEWYDWIHSAISKSVEEIDISISESKTSKHSDFLKLPCQDFKADKLECLKLSGRVLINFPGKASSSLCFPSLKTLHLSCINIANDESFNKLISACPVLETLVFRSVKCGKTLNLKICSSTLKSLSLFLRDVEHKLEINTPALEYLEIEEHYHEVSFIGKLSGLNEAKIKFNSGISLNQLLTKALYKVKDLYLAPFWFFEPVPHGGDFPLFCNLVRLEILIALSGWDILSHLLTVSDNLAFLVIENNSTIDSRWIQPEHVPTCVASHLTTVCFKAFQGLGNELEIIEYLSKNARVLETMKICTLNMSVDSKSYVLNRLSEFQWCSDTFQGSNVE